ncbi:hypothetical protein ES705_15117 [subsurface metagenome]
MKSWIFKLLKGKSSSDLVRSITAIRNSVCAILRIHRETQNRFQLTIVGTAWCIVPRRIFVSAFHILNNGQPRNPNDNFFRFFVPNNGPRAWPTPVVNFLLEDANVDMAILEVNSAPLQALQIPAIPVTFESVPDGERVLTCGFPAPRIVRPNVDQNGNWIGGELFLKSHANEGIISGQFDISGIRIYELNVGWHHGESGGPILRIKPLSAIAIMQRYRNIQSLIHHYYSH